jgi:hypothetical protein
MASLGLGRAGMAGAQCIWAQGLVFDLRSAVVVPSVMSEKKPPIKLAERIRDKPPESLAPKQDAPCSSKCKLDEKLKKCPTMPKAMILWKEAIRVYETGGTYMPRLCDACSPYFLYRMNDIGLYCELTHVSELPEVSQLKKCKASSASDGAKPEEVSEGSVEHEPLDVRRCEALFGGVL